MEVYRLTRQSFANDLSGKGAAQRGARWNSMGVCMTYTAINRSLAMAEVAVHFNLATLPNDYCMVTIYIPDSISLCKLNIQDLPPNWNRFPPPITTQSIGDKFIAENKYCVLQIPSVVTFGDFNLLINPKHPDFKHIKIINTEHFPLDTRIFK